jgi:hypothetical protein
MPILMSLNSTCSNLVWIPPPKRTLTLFQVQCTSEMVFTGNPWVDVFISTGQTCHAAHHILPFQKSGWSNVVVLPLVRALAEKRGVVWKAPVPFWSRLLPRYVSTVVTAPPTGGLTEGFFEENMSLDALKLAAAYVMEAALLPV